MFTKLRKFNGAGRLALALVAISLMAAVGYGVLWTEPVSTPGNYSENIHGFKVNKSLWVGADATNVTNASITAKAAYFVGFIPVAWEQCTATAGNQCCIGGLTPNPSATQDLLITDYVGNASGTGYGYAWQSQAPPMSSCPEYQDE